MNLDQLPETLLIRIFECLSAPQRIEIETVSRKWNFLSKCAWTKFSLIDESSFNCDSQKSSQKVNAGKFMTLLMSRSGKYLNAINISEHWHIKDIDAGLCSNLKTIIISSATITPISLRSFADNCCQLTSVEFSNCFSDINVDPELTYLFFNCPHLTSVKLSCNTKLTGKCLAVLPIELKWLFIIGCSAMRDKQFRSVVDRCKNLELLDLALCDQVSTHSLDYLCKDLNSLKFLCLTATEVNDNNLHTISRSCTKLETMDLIECHNFTDAGLISLSQLHHLTDLNLALCDQITDNGIKELAKLKKLETLNLRFVRRVTDDSVTKLAKCCLNLRDICLRYCNNITIESIYAFYNTARYRTNRLLLDITQTNIFENDVEAFRPELEFIFQ